MKRIHIFISIISLFFTLHISSQNNDNKAVVEKDSVPKVKQKYGIRIGVDIAKPLVSLFEKNQKGLGFLGDIRINKKYYVAAELGYESKEINEDFFNVTTEGSFLKMGANRNLYKNWGTMNNEIFVGARYALAFFKQTLNSYTPNVSTPYFPPIPKNKKQEFGNLSAHWLELVFGLKVETFKNVFLGANIQFKQLIYSKKPDNFINIHIPGFQDVSFNNLGFGFSYTVSYLIPVIKK